MMQAARDFTTNLRSGLRLALGLPVSLLDFRASVLQLVLLYGFGVALDIGVDYLQTEWGAAFSPHGFVTEGFGAAVLLLTAAILAAAFRQPHLKLALPVLVVASTPVLALVALAVFGLARGPDLLGGWGYFGGYAFYIAFLAFIFWRAMASALAPGRPRLALRSLVGTALLMLAVPLALWAHQPWWYLPSPAAAYDANVPSPASEEVLAAQPRLLEEALAALEDERPGVADLYFVGFAPYAREDVFRKDVELARDLMNERFDTEGRSVVLINNPRTMLAEPLATVSNLRETLNEIGAAINPEEDVVMLYLTSHGSTKHELAVEFWPLQLRQLTPAALRRMLDEAGIKWRILVVSACYSGGYVDALKDESTLVITASAHDRQSFGCGSESEATYFGEAFFNQALRGEDSFVRAFDKARELIAQRERAEGRSPPSDPQLDLGAAMAEKLKTLERGKTARRAGRTA